jgi:hypothetical protein
VLPRAALDAGLIVAAYRAARARGRPA